jgi:hypothetical protein
MALTFPISASIGQTYQSGSSNTYEWTGTYWKIKNITTRDFVGRTEYNIFSASINSVDKSFATTGSNHFYGDQTITGNLSANNFSADSSNVSLYANFSPNRIALETFNGANIILDTNQQGHIDISSPNVNVNSTINISGSIIPNTGIGTNTSSFSLGSATNAWKDLYISHGSIIFVDAQTQATTSFSIENNAGGQNTVKYTAAVTASAYLGDGRQLTNLSANTNWNNTYDSYLIRKTEQLTFSGDYILDRAFLLIEGSTPNSIGEWDIRIGEHSGSISKTANNRYLIEGPNSTGGASDGNLITQYFATATTMSIGYIWSSEDAGNEWPTYDITIGSYPYEISTPNILSNPNASSESGTWTINVPADSYLTLGIWSGNSDNLTSSLQLTLPYTTFGDEIQYSPNKYFKKEGSIFIGGNLLLKDSRIENNGKISVGGEVILIGNSSIEGTGTII